MRLQLNTSVNLWIYLIAIILVAAPFIGVQNIGWIDFPNHLARYHILENHESSPALQSLYNLKDGFYPYWGMEGFMTLLSPALGVETAARYFAIASLLTPVVGTLLIAKAAHKNISFFTLIACAFIFSEVAAWGFVNFLFTLGIAMCVFALWISCTHVKAYIKIPIFALLAFIICAMHMISAGFLGLFIGFWELYPIIKSRKITRDDVIKYIGIALVFIPAALLILAQSSDEFGGQDTFYGPLLYRIQSTQSPFNFMADLRQQNFTSLIIGIVILTIIVIGRRDNADENSELDSTHKVFIVSPRLGFMAIVFFAMSLLVPFAISGVAYVNMRFPLIAILFLAASIKDIPGIKAPIFKTVLIVLLSAKSVWSHLKLSKVDKEIRELRTASQVIPKGARILPVGNNIKIDDSDIAISMVPLYYTHQAAWITVERDALFPYFFSMFNVGINKDHERQTVPHDFAVSLENFDTKRARSYSHYWREDFDYILLMHFGPDYNQPDDTQLLHSGSWFDILQVEK